MKALALMLLSSGCGLDPQIWGHVTNDDFDEPPPAGEHTVAGTTELGAATVTFYTPAGVALAAQGTTAGTDGAFETRFPATTSFIDSIVVASSATRAAWGIVPDVPAKEDIHDPSLALTMGTGVDGETVAFMDVLGGESTFATLVLLAKQRGQASSLAALSPEVATQALVDLQALVVENDPRVMPLHDMVLRIAADTTTRPPLAPFAPVGTSYLDPGALSEGFDYSGDGLPDGDTLAFDAALVDATNALELDICYAPDTIRVVLVVDFREGGVDRNCSTIDRWKWTLEGAGKQMFVTGALHPSTPACDVDAPPCLDAATFDAASQLMGNWSPNIVPMYDDGTHGDALAGDDLWSIAFELPWFDAGAPTARWVRIAYKYTWGTPGALWTGSEEWPGNQRILELRDVNGDHLIVRQDFYGDETTNKDLSNLRSPAKGGCGDVLWQSELNPPPEGRRTTCIDDSLESLIDVDRDCTLESWPSLFGAGPLTVPCEQ